MQSNREKIQTVLDVNMVVEAGAGTGKTTLLITRLCLAVLARGTSVEKLVALTFTEKAAAEIKTRLITALHEVLAAAREGKEHPVLTLLRERFGMPDDKLVSRAENALARLDRACVGTIHGFCAEILKTFPLEAGLSPNSEIDSGRRASQLFDARWNTFLDTELGVNAPRAEEWKKVLPEISLPDLKEFARELCSGKIDEYDYFARAPMLADVCLEKAARAEALSKAFLYGKKPRKAEKMLAFAAESLRRTAAFLRGEPLPPAPQELPEPLSSSSTAPQGWEEEAYEEARALVQFAVKTDPEKQQIFLSAFHLVQPIAREIRASYEREGILSFDDLIVKTRNLLQKDFYVRRLLKEKYDALFIDEFQDTDPVQGELFLFLAEEKSSCASRWQDVVLEAGKLFVVGDPKQSIYRFRGADITAYELFTDLILKQGGEKCFLQQNFRSAPDIVSMANAVCARAMVQETSFQPAYVPIFPARELPSPAVKWIFIAGQDDKPRADNFRANQAERIADWIENNVGRLTLSNGQKLAYKDITLLSRASTTSAPYTDALRRRGIPFNVETDKDFYRKQEVNDFLNFLRAAADPADRTALAGVLRSPLGGFTDEEIYQISRRGELSLRAKPQDKKLADLYELIRSFGNRAGRTPLKDFLEDVLEETFLPEACAAAYEGEQTLASLNRLIHLAEGYAGEVPASLGRFLAEVPELLANEPERLGASPADDALDAVSVMTVHKSKGLGFPVVILADLSKKDSASASQPAGHIFSWQYNMHGLRAGKICDIKLAFLEEEQKKHERCEEVRVLYVGLTRAKEHLVLVSDGRAGAEKAAGAFLGAGLFPDGKVRTLHHAELSVPVINAPYEEPETFIFRHTTARIPSVPAREMSAWKNACAARRARYERMLRNPELSPSSLVQTPDLLTEEQRAGAEVGTICHQALERLLMRRAPDAASAVRQAAASAGLPLRVQDALSVLEPFCQSALFAELINSQTLACEMPFALAEPDGVKSGVIDAVLRRADGTVWVVDFKTDRAPAGGADKLLEKYRPQLEVYKRAAEKIFAGERVICSAVFLRLVAARNL